MRWRSQFDSILQRTHPDSKIRGNCMRMLAICVLSASLVWLLDPALFMHFAPSLLLANALPLALAIALLYGILGRLLFTAVLASALGWVLFKVNAIKELNLDEPLMPGDLVLWRQVGNNIGFFSHYAGYRVIALLFAAAMAVAASIWVIRLEHRWQRPGWMVRLAWSGVSLALLILLFHSGGEGWGIYSNQRLSGNSGRGPNESVRQEGLLVSLVRMSQVQRVNLPVPDRAIVAEFLRSHADDLRARAGRPVPVELPDIVVVQSEAFFDPGIVKSIEFGQFTPNFSRLAETGISGGLATPTYGGLTIRTEFETLTGYPMRAFPDIEFPYYGLAAGWMPTVPHRLESMGYTTTLFHPFRADFWNREEVVPELGFQSTHFERDFAGAAHAGTYVSDRALFDFVLAHLDATPGKPSYTMVITMENHGPWDHRDDPPVGLLKDKPLPRGLSAQGTEEMNYYLSHLVNGDAALGNFAQRLLARPRWTLLLFYGDHLPSLSSAFDDLGFDDNGLPANEHTRFMMLSNRPIAPSFPRQAELHAYDLPGLLFDLAGLPEDGYLAVAASIRQSRMHDSSPSAEEFQRLQFNAADLEVSCKGKLGTTDACARQILPVAASKPGR